jgi:hypothetical protein
MVSDETSFTLNRKKIISKGQNTVVSKTEPAKIKISLRGSNPTKKE